VKRSLIGQEVKKINTVEDRKSSRNGIVSTVVVVSSGGKEESMVLESGCNSHVGVASASTLVNYSRPLIRLVGKLQGYQSSLLLDSGASCNFLSLNFVERHKIVVSPFKKNGLVNVEEEEDVVLADGSRQKIVGVVHGMSSTFDGFTGMIDFVVLPLHGCDAILGMPWLEDVNPVVDWKNRQVSKLKSKSKLKLESKSKLKSDQIDEFGELRSIVDDRVGSRKSEVEVGVEVDDSLLRSSSLLNMISAKQVKKSIDWKEDQLYWVMVQSVDRSSEDPDRKGSEMVLLDRFVDVFPENLPSGLPPGREIDHRIELEPGTNPPVRPTYRMSPSELDELKKQLDELIAQGFIRPSKSPFLVLLCYSLKRKMVQAECVLIIEL
jgi:hypothetical protein